LKIPSQNPKDNHSNQNNTHNTSSKTMIEQIKEIKKFKDKISKAERNKIVNYLKSKKLIK
jgi:hypothetical protein